MEGINEAIRKIMGFIREIPLGDATVNDYQQRYRYIIDHCEKNDITQFSQSEAQSFIEIQTGRCINGEISERHLRKLRRSASLLADIMDGKHFIWKSVVFPKRTLSEGFANVLVRYESYLAPLLAAGTIQCTMSIIKHFLFFLENNEMFDFTQLAAEHVKRYMQSVAEKHQNTMMDLAWALRKFIIFLNETEQSALDADRYLLRPAPRRKKALPCFTYPEADAILSVADTKTALGKRDYAIMVLAIETGLRGADIISLKLSDIDWIRFEIAIIQSKTGEAIYLPLMVDVGNAIADYILHARPKSDSPHIFLRTVAPYVRLGNLGNGKNIMSRYLGNAGIQHDAWDGKTFHAFRRTRGTRLLEAEVPLPDVAQLLGQKDINSPKRYLSNNEEKMRACCLDISKYATRKEGLA